MNPNPYLVDNLAEVTGYYVSALVDAMLADDMNPLLSEFAFDCLYLETWYPQAFVLDMLQFVFEVVEEVHGDYESEKLMAEVGQRMISTLVLPPMRTVEDGVGAIASIYNLSHRQRDEAESLFVDKVGERYIEVTNATPYPDELIFGHLHAIVERLLDREPYAAVEFAEPLTMVDGTQYTVFGVSY